MNKQTVITSPTRCFYDVSFPFARSRQVLLNPMKIQIEGNLQHNRNDWQEGKGADNVEQFRGNPYALVVLHNVCESLAMFLP